MKLPGIKKIMVMLAGLAVLQALFIIGQAISLSLAITGLWSGKNLSEVIKWMGTFAASFVGRQLIELVRDRMLDKFAYSSAQQIRTTLLNKIFKLGPEVVQQVGTGNITTMTLDGIDQVENYIKLILSKVMNMMLIPWFVLATVFVFDWESGLVLTLVFPLIIIFMIILGYAAKSKADNQYAKFEMLSNHFIDSLRGISVLKYFGLSKKYADSIYTTSEQFRKATMSTIKVAILSTFALDFFTTLSIAVVAVLLGLRLINEKIFLFPALSILILTPEYFQPVRNFSSDYHATLDGKNAMTAIYNIIDNPGNKSESVKINPWTEQSQLTINHLDFNYQDSFGVKNLKLNIQGYNKVGIIGMSGSGKTTLINLLSGFFTPERSDIQIDNSNLESLNQADWQKQLIYMPQTPYVFHKTIRENVAFYHPNASDKDVRLAIEAVGLTSFVDELPDHLDTVLGEGSRALSGGQAQRIALARALIDSGRKIMLFDEPTAHLDIETEIDLKDKMLPMMDQRLVFFATHRLHWMKDMDYILVMKHGELVEQGTLEQLQQNNGPFVELTNAMIGGEADV
ncbi:transport ATP-binding protein CydC [Paucilactobacillus oligofermentans DSM 15707 = LMG 22743]|uniref:Transport ATP-binding protein CydC n=2 Tax=Paucilactobacillus oligofermentans TaxID=293371 RepID=A0A0R1RGY9_9LACO|nr:transport ATP-binding protein CydC [Paucilactobacillus oligofermentans DSM 15707 = LMG 22743]